MGSTAPPAHGTTTGSRTDARFAEYARTKDRRLRDELILEYTGLAEGLARRFAGRSEPLDDLVQVAALGLLKAVERYDPHKGFPFTTFAVPTILGELRRHFRDCGWSIRVPRRLQELAPLVRSASAELAQSLGRPPRVQEIAESLDTGVEDVLEAMNATHAYQPASLDVDDQDQGVPVIHSDPQLERSEQRQVVRRLLRALPEWDRRIVYLRFFEDLTQSRIAQLTGTSQMQVSRVLARSARRMRQQAS